MSVFVTFEGIDGTGKSTQIKLLQEWLSGEGYDVLTAREPGGTELGEVIRAVLLDPKWNHMSARTEFLLYSASRAQLVDEVIWHHLVKPQAVVLLDRYDDSSSAYQGGGRGLGIDTIEKINRFATAGLTPDVTFMLDVSYEVAVERRQQTGQSADRLEKNDREFFEHTRMAYRDLCTRHAARMHLIDATKSETAVFAEIQRILRGIL